MTYQVDLRQVRRNFLIETGGVRSQYFDVQWAEDAQSFYVLMTSLGAKRAQLYCCDPRQW